MVVSEMSVEDMKLRMNLRYTAATSHKAFELAYRNNPVEALNVKTVPSLELGKVYHTEVYSYKNLLYRNSHEYATVLCIPVTFADYYSSHNVFKVLATNDPDFRPFDKGKDIADIRYDTFWSMQFYRNVHEILCEDLPLYMDLDYKSSMFIESLNNGCFPL